MIIQKDMHVISLKGETNEIDERGEFHTGPCALGIVAEIYPDQHDCYSVVFAASGASIMLSDDEIFSGDYVVTGTPAAYCKVMVHYPPEDEVVPDAFLVTETQAADIARKLRMTPGVLFTAVMPLS